MTHDQIEKYRVDKAGILVGDPTKRVGSLIDLAKDVGANTINRYTGQGPAKIPELVENIDNALQTASMIEMCRIAARNFWVAIIATIIALISALAAWLAVVKMVR